MLYLGWRFWQIEDIYCLGPYSSFSSAFARWSIQARSEIVLADNSSRYGSWKQGNGLWKKKLNIDFCIDWIPRQKYMIY
jgi:hypothetical protein